MTQAGLLSLWEAGHLLSPLDRAVLAGGAAARGAGGDAADWPLGKRNRMLGALHRELFGPRMHGVTRCVRCAVQLEFAFDAQNLADSFSEPYAERVPVGKWVFRLPTSRLLAAAQVEESAEAATRRLLSECLAMPEPASADWSEAEVAAIEEQLATADPMAEIWLHFDCPACAASFDETLDVAAFVWAEIEALARRTLREVHALASAYGWSESEILALSDARREAYLEMVLA